MKMNQVFKTLLVGCVFVAGVACSGSDKKAVQQEKKEPVRKVTTEIAATQDVQLSSVFTGNVEGYTINNITPQQPRRISKLMVDVGDKVYAGQKVAVLDESALAQAKAQYDNNKASFERADELYKFGGESKANWEAVKTAYEVSKLTYENLLENTTLISPIAGVVTARNYDEGDMVVGQPIFVVQKINPAKIFINVSESLYSYVKKGMEVDVVVDALPAETFKGKVSRITPSIDPATRTFAVEITVANAKELLKPGMYARVTMNYGTRQSIVVPDQAVIKLLGSGDRHVYVLQEDGTVKIHVVELGVREGATYEILSGLEPGDVVITSGNTALKDGMKVEIVNE
jgi:RND family efflux transporter MFP subunit